MWSEHILEVENTNFAETLTWKCPYYRTNQNIETVPLTISNESVEVN